MNNRLIILVFVCIVLIIYLFSINKNDYENDIDYFERVSEWDNYARFDDQRDKKIYLPYNLRDSLFFIKTYIKRQDQVDFLCCESKKREALEISKKLNDSIAIADSYVDLAFLNFLETDSSIYESYLDSAKKVLPENPIIQYESFRLRGLRAWSSSNLVSSIKFLIKCDSILRRNAPWAESLLFINLTEIYTRTNIITNTNLIPEKIREDKSPSHIVRMALKKYYVSTFDQQLKINPDSAKKLIPRIEELRYNKDVSIFWASYYLAINEPKNGIKAIQSSLLDYNTNYSYLSNRYLLLAELFQKNNQFDSALFFTKKAISRSVIEKDIKILNQALLNNVNIFIYKEELDSADFYLDSILTNNKTPATYLAKAYNYLEQIEKTRGNFEMAYKARTYADSILINHNNNDLSRAKGIYIEYLNKVLNENIKEKELAYSRDRLLLTIISILLFIIVAILFYYSRLEKSKSEKIKSLNMSLTQANKVLDKKVEERTNEIKKKNKELELKNEKLTFYAFTNAHRLRAPVASILGLSALFDKKKSTEEDRENIVKMINIETQKLDKVVKEIQVNLDE